ncbi:serine acetyltransferase [Bacteroidia bacterium]|nr:serine acetyltransferase [Bacteroidia bacterium]
MDISTKEELKKILRFEKRMYIGERGFKSLLFDTYIVNDESVLVYKFLKMLRVLNYYHSKKSSSKWYKFLYYCEKRRKNKLGQKLGLNIGEFTFDEGLFIPHINDIVVNGEAKVGKNCILHGCNCIGRDGKSTDSPIIGDNVDIGFGASVLGGIQLGNNIKIGAGAVVTKSCLEDGVTLIGVPARIKNNR